MNYRSMLNMFNSKLRLFSESLFLDFQNTQCIHLLKLLFSVIIFLTISPNFLSSLKSESRSVMSDSLQAHDYTVHVILQARIVEWVACHFSSGSSLPRDRTGVSYIAGRFFTNWASRKPKFLEIKLNFFFISVYLWLKHQLIASYTQ